MKVIFYTIVLAIFLCACKNSDSVDSNNEIISVDLNKEYPTLDIKLSDLADVSFIALGGSDTVNIMTSLFVLNNHICIDEDLMIVGDCMPGYRDVESKCKNEIYLFDTCGHFIRSFGEGIKKANGMNSFKNLRVFPKENIIGIHKVITEEQIILFYDYFGNVVKTDTLDKSYLFSAVIDNKLVLYDHHSSFISMFSNKHIERGCTINVYNLETGDYESVQDIRHKFVKNDNKVSATPALYPAGNKIYISSPRTDTVYVIDDNLKITAQFNSINSCMDNPDERNIIYPIIETSEYIIFCNGMDYNSQKTKRFKFGNWIYVKQDKQIYKITDMGYLGNKESYDNPTYVSHLLNDEVFLSSNFNTQNSDILICSISPQYLIEHFTELPMDLQKIAANLRKDDNPVLMVMKFGKELNLH